VRLREDDRGEEREHSLTVSSDEEW
jgi:hypothetical protein